MKVRIKIGEHPDFIVYTASANGTKLSGTADDLAEVIQKLATFLDWTIK